MNVEKQHYDVVVVGSGMAGMSAASHASKEGAHVLVVSKDPVICSDSKISEGIITVRGSGSSEDTVDELSANVQNSGGDLSKPELARAFAEGSLEGYQWLRDNGLRPRTDPDTDMPIPFGVPMGGHSLPRSVNHKHGGVEHSHALWQAVLASGQIDYMEDAWFLELYRNDEGEKEVFGGLIYHATEGKFISVIASAVIVACGGLNTLYYPHTDTMKGNSGDGYAIAGRVGAQLVDMEQVQFIPFAIAEPGSYHGLVVGEPFTAGALGVIRDKNNEIVMNEVMARTRAECSAIIATTVAEGNGTDNDACYLDLTANIQGKSGEMYKAIFKNNFDSIINTVKRTLGGAAARFEVPWEVKPSAHYCMGGISATEKAEAVDADESVIPGLYSAGQALGGLHGANRLGSTSLAECLVFGNIAGKSAAIYSNLPRKTDETRRSEIEVGIAEFYKSKLGNGSGNYAIKLLRELQKSAWHGIGPARDKQSIEATIEETARLNALNENAIISDDVIWNQPFLDYVECRNMLFCSDVVAKSALLRTSSLGAHVRLDEPAHLDENDFVEEKQSYSTICFLKDQQMVVKKLERPASPLEQEQAQLKIREETLQKFKKFRTMPQDQREPVLMDMYQRIAGEPL